MTLLTLSASVRRLKPTCNNGTCHTTSSQKTTFFIPIYLIAFGTGGIKPCVSSLTADQFDENEQKTKSSFFNWFYFSINVGALIASSALVSIQSKVGWDWGFCVLAVAMAIALVFFFSGTHLYRLQPPAGSPLTRIFQVFVAFIRKFYVKTPHDETLLYETADTESIIIERRKLEHSDEFRRQSRE